MAFIMNVQNKMPYQDKHNTRMSIKRKEESLGVYDINIVKPEGLWFKLCQKGH